jgi:hypothetical protein
MAAVARSLARGLAALVLLCMGISLFAHLSAWPIERISLMIVLPALLGITLAFAPDPPGCGTGSRGTI